MDKKTMKRPFPHVDKNMNHLKTASTVLFDKSSSRSDFSNTRLSQSLSVKNKSSRQKQTKQLFQQHVEHDSKVNGTVNTMRSGDNKKMKLIRPQKSAERKQNIEMKAESHTQMKQLSKQISLPAVKQVQSLVSKTDANSSQNVTTVSVVKNDETTDKKIHKRKTNAKKRQDGASNWMKLCATLNIDASVRKTKPVKRPAPDNNIEPKRAKTGVWFDNVDKILIETDEKAAVAAQASSGKEGTTVAEHDASDKLVKPDSFKGVTNCVAMDCEMVGIGPQGEESILARVSVVNHFGVCLYDKFVLPREKVTDYRTFVSGVTPEKLATGEEFTKVQAEVSELIHDRILVGHAVHNDLKVLFLTHPHKMIRDTSLYKPFRKLFNGRLPSLKKLTEKVLGVRVQEGQHSSIQDAQATIRLYTMYRQKWEKELRKEWKTDKRKKKKKNKLHKKESVV